MYDHICELLVRHGARLVHTTNRVVGETLRRVSPGYASFHSEVSSNEKIAFELSLAGSCLSKRTACLFTTEGLYEALDPLVISAYTGVTGGFLIICVRETAEEVTPLGPFSKVPVIVSETLNDLARSVEFGYMISEKYGLPVILQTTHEADKVLIDNDSSSSPGLRHSTSVRDHGRRAATPKCRCDLHKALDDKIEKIRHEFERYEGNRVAIRGSTGLITDRQDSIEIYGDDLSVLHLSTLYPLPGELVSSFVAQMEEVFLAEGPYPVIESQVSDRSKIIVEPMRPGHSRTKPEEMMYGLRVVRDTIGPGSSINMAHAMRKLEPEAKVLAITFEDHFFHSGMAAVVNALSNDSSFLILVLTREREEEMKQVFGGFGIRNYFHINNVFEIERFRDNEELTVLFYKGII